MYTADPTKTLLGRGKVFFDRFNDSGGSTGLRFLGTVSRFEIEVSDERAKIYDYSRADAPLLQEALTRREINVRMTLQEFSRENVALALMGKELQHTQTATPVTGEQLTSSVKLGRSYLVANGRNIGSITVKKGPLPGTSLVAGTDYDVVDTKLGLIHIREDSVTLSDGNSVFIDYTPASLPTPGLNKVAAATAPTITGKLVYIGDPAAGVAYDGEFWKVQIRPEGVVGLITESEFGTFELGASVLSDEVNDADEPYFRLTQRA